MNVGGGRCSMIGRVFAAVGLAATHGLMKRGSDFVGLLEKPDIRFEPRPWRTTKSGVSVLHDGEIHTSRATAAIFNAGSRQPSPDRLGALA